jgi:hypothetical protein
LSSTQFWHSRGGDCTMKCAVWASSLSEDRPFCHRCERESSVSARQLITSACRHSQRPIPGGTLRHSGSDLHLHPKLHSLLLTSISRPCRPVVGADVVDYSTSPVSSAVTLFSTICSTKTIRSSTATIPSPIGDHRFFWPLRAIYRRQIGSVSLATHLEIQASISILWIV